MKQHTYLCCLLLSLLDRHSSYKVWNFIKVKNLENLLFYDFQSKTNMIVIEDDQIKIDEFKFDEKSNVNNDKYENLYFSELSNQQEGEYQLDKGSIIWKIKIEDFK